MYKFLSGYFVRALAVLICAAGIFGAAQLMFTSAHAVPAPQTWFDLTKLPQVARSTPLTSDSGDSLYHSHINMYGDHPCTPDSEDDCWYDTSVGKIEKNGFKFKIPFNDTTWYVDGAESQLIVTPNPHAFMHIIQNQDTGLYQVYFRTPEMAALAIGYDEEMPVATFAVPDTDPSVVELTHGDGQPWEVDDNTLYSQIGYSAHGQWMSIWNQSGYVVIVNLNDFSTRTIGVGAPIDFALSTISDDGRYMALSTTDGTLTLYDLSRCGAGGAVDGVATESCPVRDVGAALGAYLGEAEGMPVNFGVPQFVDDDILKYTTKPDYEQYYIWAPDTNLPTEDETIHQTIYPPMPELNYIALGDSYASGEGEGNDTFYGGTDVQNVNMCHLSWLSYPYLISQATWLDSVHSVACSGAKIADVTKGAQHPTVPQQNHLGYWLPGYQKQLQFVQDKHPSIVTISMSGNDIGFSDIITACVKIGTCYDTREDRQELIGLINRQFDRLVDMYQQVQQAAAPNAHIYVVSYPSIVKPDGNCGSNVHLDAKETEFANSLIAYLDTVIKKATQKVGIGYVNAEDAFAGYRLCETTTTFAVNGITIGHDSNPIDDNLQFKFLSNGSFHPTQYGHQLLALAIEQQTEDFTVPMPRPNSAITEPTENDAAGFFDDVPSTGRQVQTLQYDSDMSNDVLYGITAGPTAQPNLLSVGGLLAGSLVHAWLHSDPIDLGTFSADAQGDASFKVTLPDSTPVGFHTLYLDVTEANGQTERLFKTVYVAASPDDLDGDGVPNALEPCLIFEVPADQLSGPGYSCSASTAENTMPPTTLQNVEVSSAASSVDDIPQTPMLSQHALATSSVIPITNAQQRMAGNRHVRSPVRGKILLAVACLLVILLAVTVRYVL